MSPATHPLMRIPSWPWLAVLVCLLAACHPYPRDPEHTSARVRDGVLRVGLIHAPPFVDVHGGAAPTGPEVRMARALAASMDARVMWVEGGSEDLLDDLEHFQLDLVIGGISEHSPWRRRVSLTLPYLVRDAQGRLQYRATAVPPGENRWQMRVERFHRREATRALLRGTGPETAR